MKSLACLGILYLSMAICVQRDTDHYLRKLDICHQIFHSCASGPENVYCSCTRMCIYYDDCCFDAPAITGKLEETSEEDIHQQYLDMTTCESIVVRENYNIRQGAFMVSSCPVSWDGGIDTRQKCEWYNKTDIRDMLPVLDIKTNITFKNRHCAECHKVQKYIAWLLEITCSPEIFPPSHSVIDVLMMKIHSDHCKYRFIPPNGFEVNIHYCYHEFDYAILSNTAEPVHNASCRNRVFKPIMVRIDKNLYHFYRNLQCLIVINGSTYLEVLNVTYCAVITYHFRGRLSDSNTLSSIIDFSSVLHIQRGVMKCKDTEVHLFDEVGCQRLYCPARSEPSGGECVDLRHSTDGFLLDLLFEVNKETVAERSLFTSLFDILDNIITVLNTEGTLAVLAITTLYGDKTVTIIPGTHLNSKNACSIIHICIPVKGIINDVPIESRRSVIANVLHNYTVREYDGSVIKPIGNIQNMTCNPNVSVSSPLYVLDQISVDNDLPCPAVKVKYSGNESDIDSLIGDVLNGASDNLTFFYISGIIISPLDIVYANGDYFLCINTFLTKYQHSDQQYDTMDDYRSIINTVCSSISIICLVYFLVQYCAIPILRDGKSDLLIVLIVFLLLAQAGFLLLSHFAISSHVCELVAIIHHFTWLGSFVFMFLCSYRLNAEIRNLQTYSKSERNVVTVKYMLVGFSIPLFVIVCTKITNLCLEPMETWYGGRLCFISHSFVLLFGFVVPVFLILCGNVIVFICIIHYISSTSISASSNKSNVIVFMKLSTIMGFSWIIGIVAIMSQSDILLLIFEVLSNLQGAFITISFSCTDRVRNVYKDCVQRKNTSATNRTSS